MAIGSQPAIGEHFKACRDYTIEDWENWWRYMRENWGENLQAGYATLVHKKDSNPFYDAEERKRRNSLGKK